MKHYLLFSIPFVLGLQIACNDVTTSEQATSPEISKIEVTPEALAAGFQLLESSCFSCHSPNASIENRVAPPMEAVKRHYLKEGMTEVEFSKDFIAFLQNPTADNSKMPGAIKRFGVMPKMSFTEAQLQSIANYVFETKLEQPGWFEEHYKEEHGKYMAFVKELTPLEQGQKIAMQTKSVLGKNLISTINSKGTDQALEFCSTRAIPLTDSMSQVLHASVKRVSDKNRNPKNAASPSELAYIKSSKELLADGKKLMPKLIERDGKNVGYYPIMTNGMCLQCHGEKETQVKPSTLEKIHTAYPKDLALGYAADELRGIWVVEWEAAAESSDTH